MYCLIGLLFGFGGLLPIFALCLQFGLERLFRSFLRLILRLDERDDDDADQAQHADAEEDDGEDVIFQPVGDAGALDDVGVGSDVDDLAGGGGGKVARGDLDGHLIEPALLRHKAQVAFGIPFVGVIALVLFFIFVEDGDLAPGAEAVGVVFAFRRHYVGDGRGRGGIVQLEEIQLVLRLVAFQSHDLEIFKGIGDVYIADFGLVRLFDGGAV